MKGKAPVRQKPCARKHLGGRLSLCALPLGNGLEEAFFGDIDNGFVVEGVLILHVKEGIAKSEEPVHAFVSNLTDRKGVV